MTRHIIRRIFQAIPTIFGVTLIGYMIMAAAPGGPVAIYAFQGDPTKMSTEQGQRLAEQLGVNDPWPIQYLRWLAGDDWMWWKNQDVDGDGVIDARTNVSYGIIRGDFGDSFRYRRPALELIAERLPATIELGVAALVVSLGLGVPIGLLAAITRGGWFDNFSRVFAVVGNAVPAFWMGLMLLLIFSFNLGWLPSGHRCDPVQYSREPCPPVTQRLEYLLLPTVVLALGGVAGYSRYMRTSMLETINSDYVRTARAKGLPSRMVWFKHAARNSLIPLATFLGPSLVGIIGGAVITETIFSWPGLGLLTIKSINQQDYPVVMASVLISAILTIIAYIISDILYAVFDPRIRY
jgi:peptide/nickel transport system permease protein